MPEFEFQNGSVSIDSDELDITASPVIGIKQWFRERKSTFLISMFALLLYTVLAIYDLEPARTFLAAILVGGGIILSLWLLYYFDIFEGQITTIPRERIEEARYDSMDRVGASKVTIVYTETDGGKERTKERDIWLSFPFLGGNDRLDPAVNALRKADIRTQRASQ